MSRFSILVFLVSAALPLLLTPTLALGFFYVIFQWPGACASSKDCCLPKTWKPAVKSFTAGGLVPTDVLGNYPEYCNNASHFQISEVKNLSRSMEKYWPSSFSCASSGQNMKEMWAEQWKRYGTCSGLSQFEFFDRVIKLIQRNDLFKILEDAGILANGRFFPRDDFSDTITKAIHFPRLRCNRDKSGMSQLNQILLCADPAVTRMVDCPGWSGDPVCEHLIKFPLPM